MKKSYAFYNPSPNPIYRPNGFGIVIANIVTFSSQAVVQKTVHFCNTVYLLQLDHDCLEPAEAR